jgi:uncharacterized protein YycO
MIAAYQGRSLTSRIIQAFNWSCYSHIAWVDEQDGSVIEAWHRGGVSKAPNMSTNHTPGTSVVMFDVIDETPRHTPLIREFLQAQVGKQYDFAGILGFLIRSRRLQHDGKWFCSELVAAAYANAGIPLLNLPAFKIYPGMLVSSPRLRHAGGITTS